MPDKLKLRVVSQEKELLNASVDSVTLPGSEGELTILPTHISLMTRLEVGELVYRSGGVAASIAVSQGFLNVGADNEVIVLVDSASHARDISVQKAEAAIREAHETLRVSQNQQELLKAEAALKFALLQVRIAQKAKYS